VPLGFFEDHGLAEKPIIEGAKFTVQVKSTTSLDLRKLTELAEERCRRDSFTNAINVERTVHWIEYRA